MPVENTVSVTRTTECLIDPGIETKNTLRLNVFSSQREMNQPDVVLPKELKLNTRLKMDGVQFLAMLPQNSFTVCFFDPQYRGVLDHLGYGNEGKSRGKERCALRQMDISTIRNFISKINSILIPSGHVFLWMDKFHLCQGSVREWIDGTTLDIVDMLVWNKQRMGMGYRTRRVSEYLVILQKRPKRAKGVWKVHTIRDVWEEKLTKNGHTHRKPENLQGELIAAVSNEGDIIIDPAAGSFSVMESAQARRRRFLGCDLNG